MSLSTSEWNPQVAQVRTVDNRMALGGSEASEQMDPRFRTCNPVWKRTASDAGELHCGLTLKPYR